MKEIESRVSSLSSLKLIGLLFVDDFVGLSDLKQGLQDMIVHEHSKEWCFEANVQKCAVVFFRNERTLMVNGFWGTPLCYI